MQNFSQSSTAPCPPDLEPSEEWKQILRVNIEAGFCLSVDEAIQKLDDKLVKGIVDPEEYERLTEDYLTTIRTIRLSAENQFLAALERERQERQRGSGEQLDRAWSESMLKEQQAIRQKIEKEPERRKKGSVPRLAKVSTSPSSFQPDPPQLLPPPLPLPPPPPSVQRFQSKPDRPLESSTFTPLQPIHEPGHIYRTPAQTADLEQESGFYLSRPVSHDRDDLVASLDEPPLFRTGKARAGSVTVTDSWKAPSALDTERSLFERSKPSTIYDGSDSMPRSARTLADPADPTRSKSSRPKPSMNTGPIVHERWLPSVILKKKGCRLRGDFRKLEEETRPWRVEERKKQEIYETWSETSRLMPSQTSSFSSRWPISNDNDCSIPAAMSLPFDSASTSASGCNNSSTTSPTTATASAQPSSTPKPTSLAVPTQKPLSKGILNPPFTEAEFHRRQVQQHEEQFEPEQAKLAMLEHKRQPKTGEVTISKEEVTKPSESHRIQLDKMQTMGSLIREDLRSSQCAENQLRETVACLEKTVQGLRDQLATANKTIRYLYADLDAQKTSSADIKKIVQELTNQLAASQCALRVHEQKHQCETMFVGGRIYDAARHLLEIIDMMDEDLQHNELITNWLEDFQLRCVKKLENYADTAMDSKDHDAAIGYYSSALSLDPTNINDIIVKCCNARAGLLEDELVNAGKVIERDPWNYRGYKKKYSVLRSMGRYTEAFSAFEMMMSTMKNTVDPQVCELRSQYLDTTSLIRKVVHDTLRDIPRVLIDTLTGRLCDKTQQATVFEELPIFEELRSVMTTHDRLDYARIKQEVEKFYRYVMFSHRWQPAEPTFQMIENISIYELPESPTVTKLINFCNVVQSYRFRWAWSDTCCVNQADKGVQQESVVAMFRWYCRAALTIVHLLGVLSESQQEGDLWKSIWNTRGWTYQEYVASKFIQFYTEDWKLYLDLKLFNHKESPIILSEMEHATKFATEKLSMIEPGLDRVREKLYLASKRQTTREEDIAYSLFGIFDVSLPVIYGEGKRAVRRLLEHILTQSDDVTLLSWTGNSDSKSFLPSDLTVYDQILPPHVPQAIEMAEMDQMVMDLRSSFPDPSPIVALYKRLLGLPSLALIAGRLRLSGLVVRLTDFSRLAVPKSDSSLHTYHATAAILGEVRIETKDDSLEMQRLVHSWISPLLDEDFSGDDPLFDLDARALRILVRLRQPFGALLLASRKRGQYKRVATDSFIQVQIQPETPLNELIASIDTIDVQ